MDAYERMIEVMRRQGRKTNLPAPVLGRMGKDGTIKLGELVLETSDYLMDCNLRQGEGTMYYHTGSHADSTLTEYTNNILKEGDQVLLLRIENGGLRPYIVLAKVVAPG